MCNKRYYHTKKSEDIEFAGFIPVIIRRYANGDLIALFPSERATCKSHLIGSYMTRGGHGAADYNVVSQQTEPANYDDDDVINFMTRYNQQPGNHTQGYKLYKRNIFTPAYPLTTVE